MKKPTLRQNGHKHTTISIQFHPGIGDLKDAVFSILNYSDAMAEYSRLSHNSKDLTPFDRVKLTRKSVENRLRENLRSGGYAEYFFGRIAR